MNQDPRKYGVTFVDFLFTIAILVGVVPEGQNVAKGILSEPWITAGSLLPQQPAEMDKLLSFILALLVLILSWFGYHAAISRRPHKERNVWGMFRFVIDAFLVLLYAFALLHYKNPSDVIQVIVWIFALYICWDICLLFEAWFYFKNRIQNYRRQYNLFQSILGSMRREFVTLFWFIALFFLSCWHYLLTTRVALLVAISIVILYRINKLYIIWEWIFGLKNDNLKKQPLKIYIAGPYSHETEEGRENNTKAAIDVGIKIFKLGHYPYIPHLTHWVDKRAIEIGESMSWEDYIKWDMKWLLLCDGFLYLGSSKGADLELEAARKAEKRIYYSVDEIPVFRE